MHPTVDNCHRPPGPLVARLSRGLLDAHKLAWGSLALAAITLPGGQPVRLHAFRGVKADMTQRRPLHDLGRHAEVLKAIDEPIDIRVYFSKQLGERPPPTPSISSACARCWSAIATSPAASCRSPSSIPSRSPTPRTAPWPRACAASASIRKATGYFGLVGTNATDNDASIGFFSTDRERFLEYDVTKLVYTLANPEEARGRHDQQHPARGRPCRP